MNNRLEGKKSKECQQPGDVSTDNYEIEVFIQNDDSKSYFPDTMPDVDCAS